MNDILYERVVRSLLSESRVDSIARIIVKNIIGMISKRIELINAKKRYACIIRNVWPNRDEFTVKLNVRLRNDDDKRVNVAGHWTPGTSLLEVEVFIDSQFGVIDERVLSDVQAKAYDTVRHELEHDAQPLNVERNDDDDKENDQETLWNDMNWVQKYFTSDHEVAAFVTGLYHKAKRLRKPFIEVMDEKLEAYKWVAKHYNDVDDVDAIFKMVRTVWLGYAKKRFPKATL